MRRSSVWSFSSVSLAALAATATALVAGGGCRVFDPPSRPEAMCARACEQKAKQCSEEACLRGCNLSMDRVIEHETKAVLACVARHKVACDDPVWARCAVLVGAHADGGPPAPPPPKDYDDDQDAPAKKKNDDTDLD